LYDFCYFANLLVLLFLHVFPHSRALFLVAFSFSLGPLAWAIPTWRNSLVFHSLDKMTSIFIHLGPNILFYTMRWIYTAPEYNICDNIGTAVINGVKEGTGESICQISFLEASIFPFLPYFLWQISYLLKVEVVSKKKVDTRGYVTSFRWLLEDKKSIINKLCQRYSYTKGLLVFVGLQLCFTALTLLPVKLMFDNQFLHTTFLFAIMLISLWNGANFYIEIFQGQQRNQNNGKPSVSLETALTAPDVPPTPPVHHHHE